MHVLVPICCFCEKVRDDEGTEFGQGIWVHLKTYRFRHNLMPEEVWFSHTYCSDCVKIYREFVTVKEKLDQPHDIP
jgi:hypothetical protein